MTAPRLSPHGLAAIQRVLTAQRATNAGERLQALHQVWGTVRPQGGHHGV